MLAILIISENIIYALVHPVACISKGNGKRFVAYTVYDGSQVTGDVVERSQFFQHRKGNSAVIFFQ